MKNYINPQIGVSALASLCALQPALGTVSSLMTLGFAPYMVYQRHALREYSPVKERHERLQSKTDQLANENKTMKDSLHKLKTKFERYDLFHTTIS